MNGKGEKIGQALKSGAIEIKETLDTRFSEEIQSIIYRRIDEEQTKQMIIATMAMLDAGLSDEETIRMLQKHWDLRSTEANNFISRAHRRLKIKNYSDHTNV